MKIIAENHYTIKQLTGFFIVCIGFFITIIALFMFDPYQPSLCYASSDVSLKWFYIQHYAAILYYLFGGSAWFLPMGIGLFCYYFFYQKPFTKIWEQLFVLVLLIPVFSWLLSFKSIDYAHGFTPGGMLGLYILHYFEHSDRVLLYTGLCWYSITTISMASREYILYPIDIFKRFCRHLCYFVNRYSIDKKGIIFCSYIYYYCRYILLFMGKYIWVYGYNSIFSKKNTHSSLKDTGYQKYALDESFKQQIDMHAIKKETVDQELHISVAQEDNFVLQKNNLDKENKQDTYPLPDVTHVVSSSHEDTRRKLHDEQEMRIAVLEDKLQKFGISGKVVDISVGPVVTLFEYQPESDIKLSKILTLEDDLAMAMQALSIRILAPIPGTSVVGFEVANSTRCEVLLSDVMQSSSYKNFSGALPLILGQNIVGKPVIIDLVKMPHILVAGATGSGKSVALNAMLISLLCKLRPTELKLILIDPKRLEFASYADIAHLEFPIITDPKKAAPVLRWVITQMEDRYEQMAQAGVRNVTDYNKWLQEKGEDTLPLLVVVIDELADLMLSVGKEVEDLIARIAQMARASGIHLIVATQRPSVDVITGLIKANFPSRISFRVSSRVDSRTVLDTSGAEKLLGKGDMLFLHASSTYIDRVHGAYVSDDQIDTVVNYIRATAPPCYRDLSVEIKIQENEMSAEDDLLYQEVCDFLDTIEEVSISLLQRKFRIGYNRSARIIDYLESQGKIMPPDGGKTRKVIT